MDPTKFNELMEGARQMRDHAEGKTVDGVREVILPWSVVEHLKTDEDREAYLRAAKELNDPELLDAALADISESLKAGR